MLKLNDGRSELWQWDTGRKLTVDDECSQVHFSNKVFGRSIDIDVIGGVAIIPDILLQTDKELTAWAFVGTPENGYTKISKTFKVNRRNKPADYVFTPPEQTTLAEIMERLDDLESIQDPDSGLSKEASALLITILRNGLYSADQSANITALAAELAVTEEEEPDTPVEPEEPDEPVTPEKTLSSISATYSGGDVAVGTAVTDLTGIVVTAWYSDGSTATVTGYTLSGEIIEGINTITVTYGKLTTTFNVTGVSEAGDDTAPHVWKNGYFSSGGGIVNYNDYWYCEEYFPIDSGEHYDIYCPNSAWNPDEIQICYYDADKNFIDRPTFLGKAEILPYVGGSYVCLKSNNVPDGACFIRISGHDIGAYQNNIIITQDLHMDAAYAPYLPFENATWQDGYVGAGGGVSTDDPGYMISSYISVEPGTYRFGNSASGWTSNWYGIGIYRALHGGFIKRETAATFTVPEGAKYVRLSAQLTADTCATATLTKIS